MVGVRDHSQLPELLCHRCPGPKIVELVDTVEELQTSMISNVVGVNLVNLGDIRELLNNLAPRQCGRRFGAFTEISSDKDFRRRLKNGV